MAALCCNNTRGQYSLSFAVSGMKQAKLYKIGGDNSLLPGLPCCGGLSISSCIYTSNVLLVEPQATVFVENILN